jgi:uncharacterized protein YndB with AHSA1/START domain
MEAEDATETLRITKIVPATKERVFRAWTEPLHMKKWWRIGDGWTTPFVEVDLRVGGKISLGNQPSGGGTIIITGEFLIVEPPDRLVYTWRFPGARPEESLVTVEFKERGGQTEVVITHERSPKAMGPGAIAGWNAALEGLASYLLH